MAKKIRRDQVERLKKASREVDQAMARSRRVGWNEKNGKVASRALSTWHATARNATAAEGAQAAVELGTDRTPKPLRRAGLIRNRNTWKV